MPTTRLTLAPAASSFPGLGFCESTLPFFFRVENFFVILPTLQWARTILVRAFFKVSPTTFGTLHRITLLNVATAMRSEVIVKEHVLDVPAQSPDQLAKREPAAGVAVSVTFVPLRKVATHVAPQLIPAGELVTVPAPVPVFNTARECGGGGGGGGGAGGGGGGGGVQV